MARKTRSKRRAAPAKIAATRREYLEARRLYHKIGKQAFGARSSSRVKRDYGTVKRQYHKLGRRLASLTGRKPRRK